MRTLPPPWLQDPCPRAPLVLAGGLALPPGSGLRPGTVTPLLGDVLVVGARVEPADRARALALCLAVGAGVLVHDTAAWVWAGPAAAPAPRRAAVAQHPQAPPLPGPRPDRTRTPLPVRRVRWRPALAWTTVAGVPVTDPVLTAADCARLLAPEPARRAVAALLDLRLDVARLRQVLHEGPLPGRAAALALLDELAERPAGEPAGRPTVGAGC